MAARRQPPRRPRTALPLGALELVVQQVAGDKRLEAVGDEARLVLGRVVVAEADLHEQAGQVHGLVHRYGPKALQQLHERLVKEKLHRHVRPRLALLGLPRGHAADPGTPRLGSRARLRAIKTPNLKHFFLRRTHEGDELVAAEDKDGLFGGGAVAGFVVHLGDLIPALQPQNRLHVGLELHLQARRDDPNGKEEKILLGHCQKRG